jgi:hypothetical protein
LHGRLVLVQPCIIYHIYFSAMPQPNAVVNLWTYLDEWSRCLSSRYQRDSLYRFASFDDCSPQYQDLKLAFRAKVTSDSDVARQLLQETHYLKTLGSDPVNSPTAIHIWNLKSKPGWEVEE